MPFTTGEVRLRMISGPQETQLRYRLKDGKMRIDQPGEIIPAPPVNLLDLASGNLTILHPHNATWQEVPAAKLQPGRLGVAGLPVIGPQQGPEITAPGEAAQAPLAAVASPETGPRLPEFPPPPARMPLPPVPAAPPSGPFPGPLVPVVLPGQAPPMELKATAEQREIHGYSCTRYTLVIPREGEMSLWLAGPGFFPPFYLLEADPPDSFRDRDALAKIPALLRERDLFPLLAELKGEGGGSLLLRWEVTAIAAGTADDDSLFRVPPGFQPLAPP